MGRNWKGAYSVVIYLYFVFGILVADAKDFGVLAHTYEIKEQDIVEYIKQRLQKIDLDALNQEMRQKVEEGIERPKPVVGITNTKEERTWIYDPTFVLQEAIYDAKGNLIYPKGTIINPLEKTSLSSSLIFIDGDDESQIEYALRESKLLNEEVKIILVKGSPIKLQKLHKIWIYFDQFGFLTSKFGIKHVPASVMQEGKGLKIREIVINQDSKVLNEKSTKN